MIQVDICRWDFGAVMGVPDSGAGCQVGGFQSQVEAGGGAPPSEESAHAGEYARADDTPGTSLRGPGTALLSPTSSFVLEWL